MSLDIEVSKDGYKILRLEFQGKKRYLGSKYNQKREIEKFLDSFGEISEKDNFIVFGLSFCEHIKELIGLASASSNILIIEHNAEVFEYCRNDFDLQNIMNNPRITVTNNENGINEFFKHHINEGNINNLKVSQYCQYLKLFQDELQEKYLCVKNNITNITLSRNTVINTSSIVLDNFLGNIKYMAEYSEVNVLKDKYKNIPAVIVSAGPSLSKNIDELKNKDNILIFSGGRTLKSLMNKGINPSCVGVVDPGNVAVKLVEGYIDKVKCPLFFNDCTPKQIIEQHKGNKCFAVQNQFVSEALGVKVPSLYGGGSIAHSLTLLAVYMGCNPIILVGQDLAYTNDKEHDISAIGSWKKTNDCYKLDTDLYVEDIYGKPVRTSIQLNSYRVNFERIIQENKHVKFINATEGGAKIKGVQNETLKQVLYSLKNNKVIPMDNYLCSNINRKDKIIKKLNENLEQFKMCINMCEKGEKLIKEIKFNNNLKDKNKLYKSQLGLENLHKDIQKSVMNLQLLNAELSKVIYEVENREDFTIYMKDNQKTIFNKKIKKIEVLYMGIKKVLVKNYDKIEWVIDNIKN